MTNPIVVEVLRGDRVESAHRGSGCVVDSSGAVLFAFGDIETPVYPRSSVKAFQALPLIESGAADAVGFSGAEIALACASHSGQAAHVLGVQNIFRKADIDPDDLRCGAHWPLGPEAARALAHDRQLPTQLHNNCSGKHAGFLCVAAHQGWGGQDYVEPDHPVQEAARAAIADMTGETLDERRRAVDGCSIPTYAVSLHGLARGFARFATGAGLPASRAAAARRLRDAATEFPQFIAGDGRFDTRWMELFGKKSFTKTGAEGVFIASLSEAGLGVAVKAEDGAGRAAEVMVATLIARFAAFDEAELAAAKPFLQPALSNARELPIGGLRPAGPLA